MDFKKDPYALAGTPGLDASKVERILKAFGELQRKIKHLENVRESEKKVKSKTCNDEELSVTDVQFKLLILQLQQVRAILKGNLHCQDLKKALTTSPKSLLLNNDHFKKHKKTENDCKETQTGISLYESRLEAENQCICELLKGSTKTKKCEHSVKKDEKSLSEFESKEIFSLGVSSDKASNSNISVKSNQHYHLKFDDVPFILGASSSASHNIVANIQNIIGMMKCHNKVLCGSKESKKQASKNSAVSILSKSSSQDTDNMAIDLSKDLKELKLKQAKLLEIFYAEQNSKMDVQDLSKNKKFDNLKIHKLETKKRLDQKECTATNMKLNRNVFKTKETFEKGGHAVPTNNSNSNSLQVYRKRLLRSVQDFKTHLSEEDISWD